MSQLLPLYNKATSNICLRKSFTSSSPEHFITVEMNNHLAKSKNRFHKISVFNELKATQYKLQSSLKKHTTCHHNRHSLNKVAEEPRDHKLLARSQNSLFQPDVAKNEAYSETVKKKIKENFRISPDVREKLFQISSINKQFQKACEPKKVLRKYKCQTQSNSHWLFSQSNSKEIVVNQIRKEQQIKAKMNQKLKIGRKRIQQLYQRSKGLSEDNHQKELSAKNLNKKKQYLTPQQLNDIYFQPKKILYKSIQIKSQDKIVNSVLQKQHIQNENMLQRQLLNMAVIKLENLASGGQCRFYSEYSPYFNVKQFIYNKQKFVFLKRIYDYVKKHLAQFEEIKIDQSNSINLRSLVHYIQSRNNMSQMQKRKLRKKFKFIEQ